MITRCVCHDVTFAELRALADRTGGDLADLSRRTGCGTSCGLCIPYIRLMLETRRVVFPVPPMKPAPTPSELPLAPITAQRLDPPP